MKIPTPKIIKIINTAIKQHTKLQHFCSLWLLSSDSQSFSSILYYSTKLEYGLGGGGFRRWVYREGGIGYRW